MKSFAWIVLAIFALAGGAAAAPPTALLESLAGQICYGHAGYTQIRYAIRNQNGQWAARIVYSTAGAAAGAKPVVDWHNATADGATLTFPGTQAGQIMLTVTGPHTVDMRSQTGIHSYGPYPLKCVIRARR